MRRHERDVARKREFVRRVRVQIEERRAEVGACPASCAVFGEGGGGGAYCRLVPIWAFLVASRLCRCAQQQISRPGHALAASCAALAPSMWLVWQLVQDSVGS